MKFVSYFSISVQIFLIVIIQLFGSCDVVTLKENALDEDY
jgi:hypothetical protein